MSEIFAILRQNFWINASFLKKNNQTKKHLLDIVFI